MGFISEKVHGECAHAAQRAGVADAAGAAVREVGHSYELCGAAWRQSTGGWVGEVFFPASVGADW